MVVEVLVRFGCMHARLITDLSFLPAVSVHEMAGDLAVSHSDGEIWGGWGV